MKRWFCKPPPLPEPDVLSRLQDACDEMNEAWYEARRDRPRIGIWIDWKDKEVFVTELSHTRKERTDNDQ